MTELPQPLTPADCDLRGLPFMPLDVIRLLDSDMFAEATGDEFKAAVALWCKSWTQVPAASLPNKDKVLAHLSGNAERWKRIKTGAMRGWILCSDDRWYHPVVAEKVLAALPGREEFNSKKSAEAERKARERDDRKALFELLKSHSVTPEWNVSTKALRAMASQYLSQESPDDLRDQSRDMSHSVTVSKGEGEGEGEIKGEGELTTPTPTGGEATPPRSVQIAVLLRAMGIPANSAHPLVCMTWAEDPAVSDEVLKLAVATAVEAKPGERIPVNYLENIVRRLAHPPASKGQPPAEPPKKDWL